MSVAQSDATVVPFRRPEPSATSSFRQLEDVRLLLRSEIDSRLKAMIDSAVLEAYLKAKVEELAPADNPFDPIYIAELRPDIVNSQDRKRIREFYDVVDLSHTLEIDDGMDE